MKVNYDWVYQQFMGAGVRQQVGDTVLDLLKAWEASDRGLNQEMLEDVVEVFSKLSLSQSLIKTPENESWIQSAPGGNTLKGDTVRVRHNAYPGDAGLIHNGRIGRVVAIRSGDVIFRSTDGLEPFLDGTHYSFDKLEKRVQ